MMMNKVALMAVVGVAVFAVAFKSLIFPAILRAGLAPPDMDIGPIEYLELPNHDNDDNDNDSNDHNLRTYYQGKRVLVIGGTRGVGYGIARTAALAGAAQVTIVGRSPTSGTKAIERIRLSSQGGDDAAGGASIANNIEFVQGDLGTVCSTLALVENLAAAAATVRYDYLFVTAAIFPDLRNADTISLQNEDGIDKAIAIALVGRYLIYKHMDQFMNYPMTSDENDIEHVSISRPRVMNVLASGHAGPPQSVLPFDRDIISGSKNVTGLLQGMFAFSRGNEIMIDRLFKETTASKSSSPYMMVSTFPGHLKTDLHRGQGLLFDIVEHIMMSLIGISEEECGIRQASVMVSTRLHTDRITYVSYDGHGRVKSPDLQELIDTHSDWLWSFLNDFVQEKSQRCSSSRISRNSNMESQQQ